MPQRLSWPCFSYAVPAEAMNPEESLAPSSVIPSSYHYRWNIHGAKRFLNHQKLWNMPYQIPGSLQTKTLRTFSYLLFSPMIMCKAGYRQSLTYDWSKLWPASKVLVAAPCQVTCPHFGCPATGLHLWWFAASHRHMNVIYNNFASNRHLLPIFDKNGL